MARVGASTLLDFPLKNLPLQVLIADDNQSMRMALRRVLDELPDVEVCAVALRIPSKLGLSGDVSQAIFFSSRNTRTTS